MNRTCLLSFMLLLSCSKQVDTTHPQLENISESVYASGIVKSRDQYQLYSAVNGVITDILVTEGIIVKKGDLLMVVRNTSLQLNVENAKRAAVHADLAANTNKLKEAKASMELARAKMLDDSLLLVRQRNLRAQGVGTQVELEQREFLYKSAVTNYRTAFMNYSDLQRDLLFLSDQSKINLKISNAQLNDYFIRAETDGKVYKMFRQRGELANTLTPVAVIGDASDFYIELNVDEYDISRIREGQNVLITMDSYKGKVFEARVEKIEPLMNEQSRSFVVKSLFVTQPPQLYPNLSVEANIIIREKQRALTIPRSYLIGDSLVMIGKHETRKVKVGIMDYKKVEIVGGLTSSDLIYKTSE